MATNPETKSAGFFNGATELAKFLVEQGKNLEQASMADAQNVIDIDGQKYVWNRNNWRWEPVKPVTFIPDDEITAPTISFFTLDGLIDYIVENVEGLIPTDPQHRLILQVVDHTTVRLISHPSEHHKQRTVIAKCDAHVPDITFGRYLDTELFNTQLLSNFIDTPARAELFRVIKSMTKEQSCNTTDDGVSQVITTKQGVSMAQNVVFQNPVPLKPMRTFTEVEQPESNFTLRVDEDARCALFEADGGAWQNEAVVAIRDYLKMNLCGQNVVVLA